MALTQEQRDRLLSTVSAAMKARVSGVKLTTREDRAVAKMIDGSSNRLAERATETHTAHINRGELAWSGVPDRLEDSGLTANGFTFDPSQERAIHRLIHGEHVCLIGAAGTGKTTLVKHALAKLIYGGEDVPNPIGIRALGGDQGPSIAICAFTGIATQVIRQTLPTWIHPAVKTIHSLLEYKPADEEGKMFVPTRTAENKLDHDVIIIDETSMLGLDLWHNIVDALRPHTRIILIGDLNQLKPVADATFFAYALAAGLDEVEGWSLAELTTIHRQKEAAANKIIDGAHAILNGRTPKFDDPQTDPDWRFSGFELAVKAGNAQAQIVQAIAWLRTQPTPGNPERPLFDPYQDLLLTAGNGFNENDSAAFVEQAPLNEVLSRIIEPPTEEHPCYVIDAGRETKRFAVGHRVMATKNESPAQKDRVTNGLTGRITRIEDNKNWNGNRLMFGTEKEVLEFRKQAAQSALAMLTRQNGNDSESGVPMLNLASIDTSRFTAKQEVTERQASHRITVAYANGATRTYASAADVAGIQLAYAMTVHKAQGSQADTVVIVVHQAASARLSREWLYTAVTRARRRCIILYTARGLQMAIHRQQIFGKDLREKIARYKATMESGRAYVRLRAYNVLTERDSEVENHDAAE